MEEYLAISEAERKSYDAILVQMGSIAPDVIDDQVKNNKNLKWVHSISAGVDGYVAKESFRNSDIPLSNAKGAYSDVLGEFVALGVLYHTKHVERFV
jgi:phosphoglycerate dehydrogenase-like enzyme